MQIPSSIVFKDGYKSNPRCHLDSQTDCALCGIPSYSPQLTYALRHRILGGLSVTALPPFDCALSGPFDAPPAPASQQRRLSVATPRTVISASTVYE
ncbi:MAG: hypothetical protein LBD73_00955 [Deferribacteraceae bacterium]|nr:hypothetical protein [Deferribacteraceae bacterium]